jgi:[acyl-carrier-protein] S-malonyltransferase
MGREFHDRISEVRELFEEADDVVGYGLTRLCFEGPIEELTRTDRAQPAIYLVAAAAVSGLAATGRLALDEVRAAAGLSLGEYTALWAAGAFSFADGLRLVQRRGTAMQSASEASPSGMVSLVGADRDVAERVCAAARGGGVLVVANLNAPGQVVVSGDLEACGRVPRVARELGVRRALPLKVAGAFHSPLMEPARRALEEALAETRIEAPRVPVYSNVTAEGVRDADSVRRLLALQVVSPVLWEDSIRKMLADGHDDFREPPPGRVLAGLMKKIAPQVTVAALSAESGDGSEVAG